MIDRRQVSPRLTAKFISLARHAAAAGHSVGTTSEQIVSALLNGRVDWLPEPYGNPIDAIMRLHQSGEDRLHTMLAVSRMDWRYQTEMYVERL